MLRCDGSVEVAEDDARFDVDTVIAGVDGPDAGEPAEVDDDAIADGAAGHAAPRSARDERCRGRGGPANEGDDVVGVGRDGDRPREAALDAGGLGVGPARVGVVAEDAAEAGNGECREWSVRQAPPLSPATGGKG